MRGAFAAATIPQLLATALIAGFFFLLVWFYVTNVYQLHFFDHGSMVVEWQLARFAAIPYLLWLQYTTGAFFLRLQGRAQFICGFLLGTSILHLIIFAIGMAGLLFYPVMLALAGGIMIASWRHLCEVLARIHLPHTWARDEKILGVLVVFAAIIFVLLKGAYPSGGHDFFNHYFVYYKEVVNTGNLGPHESWYHYYYSKGLGMYFLSMILFDPLAIHLVGTTFVTVAACMVYDLLRKPATPRLLPLFGVFLYLMCYIYTAGRGIFAANGGWGDLEKTHELTAVLLLGCIWLLQRFLVHRDQRYAWVLYAVCVTNVLIGFASGLVAGAFFAVALVWFILRKDTPAMRVAFLAGAVTGSSMVLMMLINYLVTGLPQDELTSILWNVIDWRKVIKLGYTLELYAQLYNLMVQSDHTLPLLPLLSKMLVEYYRLFLLWPLLAVGGVLYASRRRLVKLEGSTTIGLFMLAGYLVAMFCGGRTQFISFFRFSSFNYVPTLVLCLMLWRVASERLLRAAIFATLSVAAALVVWGAAIHPQDEGEVTFPLWMHFKVGEWEKLASAAYDLNTGEASLYNAIQNQKGRVARIMWGGIHPAMRTIYASVNPPSAGLPPMTRVWSFYNHSYCTLPTCNVQQFISQVTSPRWYDISLGSIEEGKKIMQEEGLNFFFYSRNINTVSYSDTRDQLAAFYKGFAPENIDKVFGVLWSNGWDYLLTWKEESDAPLSEEFMDSWRGYYRDYVLKHEAQFPVNELAKTVKDAIDDPTMTHPPRPAWLE